MKTCRKCGRDKLIEDYYKQANSTGYDATCKECRREAQRNNRNKKDNDRRYRLKNQDKYRENNRRHQRKYYENNRSKVIERHKNNYSPLKNSQKSHKRRSRNLGASGNHSIEQLIGRIKMWGELCYICGAEYQAIDHVIPLSRGGTNYPANLRPICNSCNSRKKDKDWRQYI